MNQYTGIRRHMVESSLKEYTIRDGLVFIETYGFKCAYCGQPLSSNFGHSKQIIAFSRIRCPNCSRILKSKKDIEYEPER
jgi:DNA-directed RNA polymerase subunit RPC12/RpoP